MIAIKTKAYYYFAILFCCALAKSSHANEQAIIQQIVAESSIPSSRGGENSATLDHSGDALFTSKVKPFFEEHCIRCHGPEKEKGGLRVDFLVADLNDHYSLSHFQNIVDELVVENMPPEEEPQPNAQEVVEVVNVFTELIEAAKEKHRSGGGRPVRRLTRTEFIYTVWDQLGVYINDDELPDDMLTGSFENNAEQLFMTDMHIQVYLQKARGITERFIASRNSEPGTYEIPVKYSKGLLQSIFRFETSDTPPAGFLTVRTAWWQREGKDGNDIVIGPAEEAIEHEVMGTRYSPQLIDFNVFEDMGPVDWEIKRSNVPSQNLSKGLTRAEQNARIRALGKYKIDQSSLVDAQEKMLIHPVVLGGIKHLKTVSRQPYEFFAPFLKDGDKLPDSAAPAIIYKFVALMKRGRSVDPDYVEKLTVVFQHGREMGLPFWEAMVEPLAVSMCSIDSIMLFEDRDPAKKNRTISGVELANRLSYTLWRTAPDAELINLGRSGELLDEKVKAQQINRMMDDVKFGRFLSDFSIQWFELARQKEIAVDQRVYQDFDYAVQPSMRDETIHFLSHVVRNNLPITNLIDSDFMVLNNLMARHYGIGGVYGPQFRVVPRTGKPEHSTRGGVLTHAGILMQGGTGDRTSIVERGAFIARKILDRPPPPPPPDAGELPTDDLSTATMTGAELVQHHASRPQCANCHAGIDPLGMGLEEFDAVGLHRAKEIRLKPGHESLTKRERRNPKNLVVSVPLDTAGYLYDGQTFEGVSQLKRVLMTKKHDLARGYIKALLTYSNGREANFSDEVIVDEILSRTTAENYPARSIIEEVVRSRMMVSY